MGDAVSRHSLHLVDIVTHASARRHKLHTALLLLKSDYVSISRQSSTTTPKCLQLLYIYQPQPNVIFNHGSSSSRSRSQSTKGI
jgi:hypothetical protein